MPFITLSLAALTGVSQYLSGEEVYCTTPALDGYPCTQTRPSLSADDVTLYMCMALYYQWHTCFHLSPFTSVRPSASIRLLLSKLDNPHLQRSATRPTIKHAYQGLSPAL